ncbi:GNAT family N-acetyltransferase [Luteipulveratus mongoliensis]|uniref:N-acetyltransferase domain-containing protein n=1 Tax=Luteipulveratus mongoliensis TaxID=571913 RepID=A0A0K1JD74_9MICO|nr:GNAT family N-acetyltransferase [Luteipulveratus mongoliensis]AKU14667.1 hypothetical protein VV02_00240 [Luteipulveratus mongoliensis]
MSDLGASIRAWQLGWTACKGLRPAYEIDGGLEVHVAQPGREREAFALSDDVETVSQLASYAAGADVPTWLTVMTNEPDRTTEALTAAGLLVPGPHETFMTAEVTRVRAQRPPDGYTVTVQQTRSVLRATVRAADGDEAASGTMAVHDDHAVAHDIVTEPDHRRRGLGSVVMARLGIAAHDLGARTAYLIASPDGERLYTSLGWEPLSSVVSGHPR